MKITRQIDQSVHLIVLLPPFSHSWKNSIQPNTINLCVWAYISQSINEMDVSQTFSKIREPEIKKR